MKEWFAQMYRYRALIQVLLMRELKGRYRGTALGFFWSFINPLLLMAIYSLVFSVYMRIQMENYTAFLLCGLLPWNCFSLGLTEGTTSILSNAGIVKKVYLPSEIFPLVYVLSNLAHFILTLPLLLGFLIFSRVEITSALLFLPIVMLVQLILMYGISLLTSSLAVKFRDLLYLIPNALMITMFLTPIFYPPVQVPENFRFLLTYNPLAQIIEAYHAIFLRGALPVMTPFLVATLFSVVLMGVGVIFFNRRKEAFIESI